MPKPVAVQPTPGALRAAKLLLPEKGTRIIIHPGETQGEGLVEGYWADVNHLAEMIDQETAAPELLEALEIIVHAYKTQRLMTAGELCGIAEAAIRKAKGESL